MIQKTINPHKSNVYLNFFEDLRGGGCVCWGGGGGGGFNFGGVAFFLTPLGHSLFLFVGGLVFVPSS